MLQTAPEQHFFEIIKEKISEKFKENNFKFSFFISTIFHVAIFAMLFLNSQNSFFFDISSRGNQGSTTFLNVSFGDDLDSNNNKITQKNNSGLAAAKAKNNDVNNKNFSDEVATLSIEDVEVSNNLAPKYPPKAYRMNQQGTVFINVLLDEKGQTQEIKVAKSSNYPLLDDAAIEAIKKWQFKPIIKNGSYMMAWVQVPVEFVIKN